MAFRKEALTAVGGFDPQFRSAGDDVDACWRLQQHGWTLGFHAGAMVWHHQRNSISGYWKQQLGYGQAEAMLERKWPEKYNVAGHVTWSGRLYGKGLTLPFGRAARIYQGTWGLAPFQHLTSDEPRLFHLLPLMPEWHLGVLVLALSALMGFAWKPLLLAVPLLLISLAAPLAQAARSAKTARFAAVQPAVRRWAMYATVMALHILQPLARL